MKLKGINPIEQHVEKIVLAGASVVTLLVVAMQFTTQPNMVQPDAKGGKLPPAKAFTPALEQAQRLKEQMKPDAGPPLPEAPTLTLIDDFKAGSARPLLETSQRIALGVPAKIGGGVIAPAADGKYAAIVVPAPTQAVAAVFEGALDPSTVVQYPELKSKELVPAAQPYDKASVSVEASFSGTELRAALEADPDGPDGELRPIPIQWWRDGVEIIGVQVERSRAVGGEWSESEAVGSLPGRVDLLSEISAAPRVTVSLLRGAVDIARMSPDSVQRPDYFPYLVGEEWIPPSDAVRRQALDERRVKIERIQETVEELNTRLAGLEADLASAPVSLTSTPPATESGGGSGGKGPGGGGRDPSRPATTGSEPKRMTKAQVQRQIDSVKRDKDAKQSELVALGVVPTDGSGAPGAPADTRAALMPTLMETPSIKVWGHDITAARGETYRYRVRVVINNPAYGNALSLPEDQRAMAESPTLASAWTDWTEPVSVDPVRTYFVTNATVADTTGGMRASASVFEFYYGYWRVGNASLSPGDPIDAKLRLPAPDLMPIFNETSLAVAPAQRPGFGDPDSGPGGGSGGKGNTGGRSPASEAGQPAQAQLPPNSEPGPRERSVSIDAVYLSTATVPVTPEAGPLGIAAGQKSQVYLRDGSGAVITRLPDVERSSDTYSRLERSAKLGERQGVPVPKVEKPKPLPRDQQPSREFNESGGGGGGGG